MFLPGHHKRKQEQEQREREEAIKKAEAEALAQQQQAFQQSMGYMSPRASAPRAMMQRSPRQQFRPPGGGVRHQPYPVTRPTRGAATPIRSPMKSPAKIDGQTIKLEPEDDTSNQSGDIMNSSQPSSPSQNAQMKSESADDANSESSSSTIQNEPGQEGLSLGADLSGLVGSNSEQTDPDVSVKLEALTESEMDELEITGVEPGRPIMPQSQQGWDPNVSMAMGYDTSGATGSQADMAGQQGYSKCSVISFLAMWLADDTAVQGIFKAGGRSQIF